MSTFVECLYYLLEEDKICLMAFPYQFLVLSPTPPTYTHTHIHTLFPILAISAFSPYSEFLYMLSFFKETHVMVSFKQLSFVILRQRDNF